jgi:hypothetical protein
LVAAEKDILPEKREFSTRGKLLYDLLTPHGNIRKFSFPVNNFPNPAINHVIASHGPRLGTGLSMEETTLIS